jgi:hypothetical protein
MIRKLIAAALLALIAAPLISLHQLGAIEGGASLSIVEEGGAAVFILETRGSIGLEPLIAAAGL